MDKIVDRAKPRRKIKQDDGSINLSDLTKLRLPKLPWIDEEDDAADVKVKFGKKMLS